MKRWESLPKEADDEPFRGSLFEGDSYRCKTQYGDTVWACYERGIGGGYAFYPCDDDGNVIDWNPIDVISVEVDRP